MRSAGKEKSLDKYQNQSLRMIAGAFRATPIYALETETYTPPLNIYLDSHLAAFRKRLGAIKIKDIIERQCEKLRKRLQRRRRYTRSTPARGAVRDQ